MKQQRTRTSYHPPPRYTAPTSDTLKAGVSHHIVQAEMEINPYKIDKRWGEYLKFRDFLNEQQRLQAKNMPFDIGQSVGLVERVDGLETGLLALGACQDSAVVALGKFRLRPCIESAPQPEREIDSSKLAEVLARSIKAQAEVHDPATDNAVWMITDHQTQELEGKLLALGHCEAEARTAIKRMMLR